MTPRRETLSPDLLVRALNAGGDRPTLAVDDRVWSAADVAAEVSRYAQAYDSWGIGVGTPIGLLSANRPEVPLHVSATMVTGARGTSLHPMGSLDDHAYLLTEAGIGTLFYDPDRFEQRAFDLAERVPGLRLISLGAGAQSPDLPTRAATFGSRRLVAPELDPDSPFQVVGTGGTTGRPKCVVSTWRAQLALTTIMLAEWDWPRGVRFLCCTPLSHAGRTAWLPTVIRGGLFVVQPGFDPDRLRHGVRRHGITTTMLVPTMIYRLLDELPEHTADLATLRRVYYGASAISPTRLREAVQRLGRVLFQFYGQAEAPMTVTVLRPDEHRPERMTSCGRPVPWVDVQLRDASGAEVAPGERGEICVRGPLVMREYLNQPELTAETLRGGWLHTGDIARADEDGYLTIVDRTRDMIVSGGFNVYPREVEDVLTTHPGVSAAAVIGVPDDRWGEAVKAVVVRRPGVGVTDRELIALVRDRKGAVQAPKTVDFVEAIPLSALGKPDKKALRAAYWPAGARQVG